jgi:L-lactate dehydrogenase
MDVTIIGMGAVGTSVAVAALGLGVARTLFVCDLDGRRAAGEAMDLAHGEAFYPTASVRAVDLDDALAGDAVVLAAGRKGAPGESRLALLRDNAAVAADLGRRLAGYRGLVVVVTNPVDVLVRIVVEASGLPPARVFGTGTTLDGARLRHALGRELGVDPRSVHAQVVGEHGDSEVVLWSGAQVGGAPLARAPGWSRAREAAVAAEVRRAADEVIARKGATNHAIGFATASLLRWTLRDERRVLTVSRVHEGACGVRDVALSLPTVVGRDGATTVIEPSMSDDERAALARSADVLRAAYERAAAAADGATRAADPARPLSGAASG